MRTTFLICLLNLAITGFCQHPNDWAKRVVWYQIFPERFSNGDPTNDPRIADQIGSYPHDTSGNWQIHPWTSDWYAFQSYEKENGKDIWWNINRRRYGGDIQGIINKLDYLQDLGIGAIYLNPVFVAPSAHKYDGTMYHHIEPTFGPDPIGDRLLIAQEDPINPKTWRWTSADKLVLKLISNCHKRGIRVIFDGVFNHLGVTSFAFDDIQKVGKNSRFADWFTIKQWPESTTGKKLEYEGWFGVQDLPEIREDEKGIVKGPREYIFNCTKRWMDPDNNGNSDDGIDGWRLDVAYCVKHQFWKDWRIFVKGINPASYLTAEVIDSIPVIAPYLESDEFDAVMNYNFAFSLASFFIGDERISATDFDLRLEKLRKAFPNISPYLMQNLFDSHDTNRMASHIVNKQRKNYGNWGEYFGWSQAKNPEYNTRKPTTEERKIQLQILAFMLCYPGAPMIYYGTESGMWGANDPDCRKPMVWKDLKYENEQVDSRGNLLQPSYTVAVDPELFATIRALIRFRKSSEILQMGEYRTMLMENKSGIFGFERRIGKDQILCIFNTSETQEIRSIKLAKDQQFTSIANGEVISSKDKILYIHIPAHGFMVLNSSSK